MIEYLLGLLLSEAPLAYHTPTANATVLYAQPYGPGILA